MITSLALLAVHGSPEIPLRDVVGMLGISMAEAQRRAARNELPVPTHRLADSQKAPLMVHIDDLAAHIDRCAAAARVSWGRSQINGGRHDAA